MHLTREVLYFIIGLFAGGLLGTINGFVLFAGWLMGYIAPVTVPEHLATNDMLAANGKARSKMLSELSFAGSNKYTFFRDDIGNITYEKKLDPTVS